MTEPALEQLQSELNSRDDLMNALRFFHDALEEARDALDEARAMLEDTHDRSGSVEESVQFEYDEADAEYKAAVRDLSAAPAARARLIAAKKTLEVVTRLRSLVLLGLGPLPSMDPAATSINPPGTRPAKEFSGVGRDAIDRYAKEHSDEVAALTERIRARRETLVKHGL